MLKVIVVAVVSTLLLCTHTDSFVVRSFRSVWSSISKNSNSVSVPITNSLFRHAINTQRMESTSLDMVRTYASVAELLNSPVNSDDEGEEEEEEPEAPQQAPIILEEGSSHEMSPMKAGIQFPTSLNGSDVRVGILMARWNGDVVQGLYKGINESLALCGVKPANIFATYVPGAYELPITAKFLAASKRFDVLVCVGCLIKGDTMHFEYIAGKPLLTLPTLPTHRQLHPVWWL